MSSVALALGESDVTTHVVETCVSNVLFAVTGFQENSSPVRRWNSGSLLPCQTAGGRSEQAVECGHVIFSASNSNQLENIALLMYQYVRIITNPMEELKLDRCDEVLGLAFDTPFYQSHAQLIELLGR